MTQDDDSSRVKSTRRTFMRGTGAAGLLSLTRPAQAEDHDGEDTPERPDNVPPEVLVSYPDTVFLNGKIVTMDDSSISKDPGTIAEAMAVNEGFVIAVGDNSEIQRLIGSETRVMDLDGKMMMPGLIDTHAHASPMDVEVGTVGIHANMMVEDNPDDTMAKLVNFIEEKIEPHHEPGEWVFVFLEPNPETEIDSSGEVAAWIRISSDIEDRLYQEDLNEIAPDYGLAIGTPTSPSKADEPGQVFREFEDGSREHLEGPELVATDGGRDNPSNEDLRDAVAAEHADGSRGSHLATMVNDYGMDLIEDRVPGHREWLTSAMLPAVDNAGERGIFGALETSALDQTVEAWTREDYREGLQNAMEQATEWGVTSLYGRRLLPEYIEAHTYLAHTDQAPVRTAIASEVHNNPMPFEAGVMLYPRMGAFWDRSGPADSGPQSKVWYIGVMTERWDSLYPGACIGNFIEDVPEEIRAREICPDPEGGQLVERIFQEALRANWRLAGVHLVGPQALMTFADLHYNAIDEGHLTKEEVREMRPAGAHSTVISAEDEVIETADDLNMLIPMNFNYLKRADSWVGDYGEEIEDFLLPARSWLDAGQKVYSEVHFGPAFPNMEIGVTREDEDGQRWATHEAIDRVEALKMFTVWAAEWSFAEDICGSLEPGKWADYIIIDRDFFEICDDDISDINVLLTAMDDEIQFEHPEFDLEFEKRGKREESGS